MLRARPGRAIPDARLGERRPCEGTQPASNHDGVGGSHARQTFNEVGHIARLNTLLHLDHQLRYDVVGGGEGQGEVYTHSGWTTRTRPPLGQQA